MEILTANVRRRMERHSFICFKPKYTADINKTCYMRWRIRLRSVWRQVRSDRSCLCCGDWDVLPRVGEFDASSDSVGA